MSNNANQLQATWRELINVLRDGKQEQARLWRTFASLPNKVKIDIMQDKRYIYTNITRITTAEDKLYNQLRRDEPAELETAILLYAIKRYTIKISRSKIQAIKREDRQKADTTLYKRESIAHVLSRLYPLIHQLHEEGITWDAIAKLLPKTERKLLDGRKVSASHLRKIYYREKQKR